MSFNDAKSQLEETLEAIRAQRAAVDDVNKEFVESRDELKASAQNLIEFSNEVGGQLTAAIERLRNLSADINAADDITSAIAGRIADWADDFRSKLDSIAGSTERLVPDFEVDSDQIKANVEEFGAELATRRDRFETRMTEQLRETIGEIEENLSEAASTLEKSYRALAEVVSQIMDETGERLKEVLASKKEAIETNDKALADHAEQVQQAMLDALRRTIEETTSRLTGLYNRSVDLIADLSATVSRFKRIQTLAQQAMDTSGIGMRAGTKSLEVVTETLNAVV
ncbi:hypothetical protein [Oricola indica]|jgi:ABC-type transporter Mla subunit MlaD|uniref:hypothetical protein n=1 Tax=Oricola indica TaxID=2872591 RepID=UPI001CBDB516|nr:hypothetical protein [Oricola indica]